MRTANFQNTGSDGVIFLFVKAGMLVVLQFGILTKKCTIRMPCTAFASMVMFVLIFIYWS